MFRKEPEIYLVRFAVSGDLWFLLGKLAPRWVDVCRGKHVFFRVHSRHSRLKKAAGCELQVEECASLPAFTKLQRATFNAQHLFPSASLCGLSALAVQILPHADGDKWARPAVTPYPARSAPRRHGPSPPSARAHGGDSPHRPAAAGCAPSSGPWPFPSRWWPRRRGIPRTRG
jgi:hypothetical protein